MLSDLDLALKTAIEEEGHEEILQAIHDGADPLAVDENGFTLLEQALRSDTESLQACLDAGYSVDWTDEQGRSLLYFCAEDNMLEQMELLLEAGASVDAQGSAMGEEGNTALHQAVKYDRQEVVSLLLQYHADPNVRNAAGQLPNQVARNKTAAWLDAERAQRVVDRATSHDLRPLA